MKSHIAAWLGLSAREMKGLVTTLLLMTIILSLPYVIASVSSVTVYDKAQDEAILDSILANMSTSPVANEVEDAAGSPIGQVVAERRIEPFNPNDLDAQAWELLGLKPYLAERMVKYRTKVQPFRVKTDLLKVYGFPDWLYKRLEPFVLLPETTPSAIAEHAIRPSENRTDTRMPAPEATKEPVYTRKQPQKFNLNTADTTQLIALRGIGAATAARIVKRREALGGFHNLEQLNEIYAITPDALASLAAYAELLPDSHRKIAINTADVETLKKHPYIGYKLAEVIVNYRRNHGPYKSPEDLQKIRIMSAETLEKLLPYLEF